jgi:hypothetical protein
MKTLEEIISEQTMEVDTYRKVAKRAVEHFCLREKAILGVLLAGSTARGDARKGPFGFMIDIIVVVNDRNIINLEQVFGPDVEPYLPYHCVSFEDTGLQIELSTVRELGSIRQKDESEIFAKQEAIILLDRTGFLEEWKTTAFLISQADMKRRSLMNYFRFQYLTDLYHQEKWSHREAWIQLAQNGNEACEYYCSFLYCINGCFIPRKDWLVYLTYSLDKRPPEHQSWIDAAYSSVLSREAAESRYEVLRKIGDWMRTFCKETGWIG